ncbi:Fc.00g100520.m01.CDS01 [Cosmosporella sp. VM-42]
MATSRSDLESLSATDVRDPIPMETLGPILTSTPFIPTRSLINIRDVGAVPGSALPTGRIFRCGTLEMAAKDPDAQAWLAANIKRVFDLRKEVERVHSPSPDIPGVLNIWFDQEGTYPAPKLEDFANGEGDSAWKVQYMAVANVYKPTIRAVLEQVRDRPTEPFLFHCTAGRDRTGIVAGLLQGLAGTSTDDIILDFMLSRLGTEPAREKLTHFAMASVGITDPETPGFYNLVALRPSFYKAFLSGLEEEYGGWDGYATKGLGFTDEELKKIKNNLRS